MAHVLVPLRERLSGNPDVNRAFVPQLTGVATEGTKQLFGRVVRRSVLGGR